MKKGVFAMDGGNPAAAAATWILNGWAASSEAWSLCGFPRERIFSYVDILDGAPRRELAGVRRVVLVGWSMGGEHALELAGEWPEKIAGLVLVAATPRMPADPATGWIGLSERRIDALERAGRLAGGAGCFDCPAGKPNPYRRDDGEALARGIAYLRETDVRERLRQAAGKLDCPVHIFHSERDGIVRSANAAYLKSLFPQAEVDIVPGGEHALSIIIPDAIDAAVSRCLAAEAERSRHG